MIKNTLQTAFIAASLTASTILHAQAVYYEGFDYADASLLEDQSAWNTDDAGATINNPPTLNTGELQVSGGEVSSAPNTEYNTVTSAISSAGLLSDGGSLWFSVVLAGDLGGSNYHGGFAFGSSAMSQTFNGVDMSGSGVGVYIKGSADATSWNSGSRDGQGSGGDALGLSSTPQLLVGRFDWGASSDTVNLWVVSDLSSIPDESTLTSGSSSAHTSAVNLDQTVFNTITWAHRDDGGPQIIDEIRFGASYGDVSPVPEPGVFTVISGSFVLMFVMLRRRRS